MKDCKFCLDFKRKLNNRITKYDAKDLGTRFYYNWIKVQEIDVYIKEFFHDENLFSLISVEDRIILKNHVENDHDIIFQDNMNSFKNKQQNRI